MLEGSPSSDAAPTGTLSSKYPGDVGMEGDPAVVWFEGFEQASVADFTSRYDDSNNPAGMALTADVPSKVTGKTSLSLTSSGDGANATDFYKSFPTGYDEWFVRWYVKYQTGAITWHHTGVWFGGYDPPLTYPYPHAGLKPDGDDRISFSIEPIWNVGGGAAQFDTYDYWMNMHSWMAVPSGDTAYYGNTVINRTSFTVDEGSWVCVEMHIKLNSDLASATGSLLEVWKNDVAEASFSDSGPKGYWIRDKFCLPSADGSECTDYPAPFDTVLDLQARTTASLPLNYLWPQNYITTSGVSGTVQYDDMVVATTRVGCQ
jgi:hypothetical protein